MQTYAISNAELSDIPKLKAIERECGLSPWSIAAYEAELRNPDSLVLAARNRNDELVGFLVGRAVTDGDAEMYNIGTERAFQRCGVGTALIKAFQAICRKRRVAGIWLDVRSVNTSAIKFYQSHGFERKGVRPHFYADPPDNADLMYAAVRQNDC